MKRIGLAFGLALLVLNTSTHSANLPDELAHLEALAASEDMLVDAMRDFHLMQNGLIDWDRELAAEYRAAGDQMLTETKRDDIRRRMYLIEAGWQYVVGRYPNSPAAMNYLGEFYYDNTSRQMDAVQLWMRAEATDGDFAPVHNNLSLHYMHNGRVRLGLKHIHEAIDLDKDNPDFLFNITQAYLLNPQEVARFYDKKPKRIYEDAMDFSRRASELQPDDFDLAQDYAVNFFAAEQFDIEPDWKAAAAAWARVLTLAQSPVQQYFANLNMARVYMRAKDWSNAKTRLNECLSIDPEQELPLELMAEVDANLAASN